MYIRYLVIFFLFLKQGYAQHYSQKTIFASFVSGNIEEWEKPIIHLENASDLFVNDSLLLTYCNLLYGITGNYIAQENDDAKKFLSKFNNAIAQLKKKTVLKSYYQSYSAAAAAYDMALYLYKIPFRANTSLSYAYAAVKTDATNPIAWVVLGNAKYYAPTIFGGDKKKALIFFYMATKLWEYNKQTDYNWMYINTMAWEGFINYQLGNFRKAKTIYNETLKIAPEFFWIKNELLPDLENKIKSID